MNGAEVLIHGMEKEGVKHIFGILGGTILDVYDVLYDCDTIKHITCRHEQVAVFAASGYARATGKVGSCMATSGPGACNLITGIADSMLDSIPIVAVTGQVPTTAIGGDSFQESDVVGVTMPITKHNYLIEDVNELPRTIKEAYFLAGTGRPGPVLMDFPKDIQRAELKDYKPPKEMKFEGYNPVYEPHPRQIKTAVKELMNAESPLMLVGGGVITSNASLELIKFAELLGVPITTTSMGKGSIPEDHPLALGMVGMHGNKWANLAVQNSDVIFTIGCRFSDRITGNIGHFAPKARMIHADIDPSEIGKNVRVDIPIVGDAKKVLSAMLSTAKTAAEKESKLAKKHTEWGQRLEQWKSEFAQETDFADVPIKPQKIICEVQKIIDSDPKNTIISTEVGRNQLWAFHYLNVRTPRNWLTSGGLGTMGAGFPMALGAQVARPDAKVLNMAGDGSFQMTMQDLATCVTNDLPVINVIFDDASLGNVRMWQRLFYEGRYSETDLKNNPDFCKIADAYGCFSRRIERPGEIAGALKEALDSGKPSIIDISIDREETVYPMVPPGGILNKMLE
jgi:acetolactate synthase I/II/III large subunit